MKKSGGFSLIEILVATAIIAVAQAALLPMFLSIFRGTTTHRSIVALGQLREAVRSCALDDTAWLHTMFAARNRANLDCILNPTLPCNPHNAGKPLALMARDGETCMKYDFGNAAAGLTRDLRPCVGFNAATGNAACPIQLEVSWVPDGCGAAPCFAPDVRIRMSLRFNDGGQTAAINTNAYATDFRRAGPSRRDLVYLEDRRSAGTPGGRCNGTQWTTRSFAGLSRRDNPIDTHGNVKALSMVGAGIADGITLGPGMWNCQVSAPAFKVHQHRVRLVTAAAPNTPLAESETVSGFVTMTSSVSHAIAQGSFELTRPTRLLVRHYCRLQHADTDFGRPLSDGGEPEVYTTLLCRRML